MKKMFYFALFFIFFSACGGLYLDDDTDRRDDDRVGEVDLPEDLTEDQSLSGILKNCKPELSVPDNTVDIITDIFGVGDKYPPRIIRECLKKKLEDGHTRICNAREELERQRDRARNDTTRARIDNSIYKLDQIQFKFNQNLYEIAVDLDEELIKLEGKPRRNNDVGRFFDWLRREETEATRDIFDIESYSECNFYSDDDD